jgi:hypothetical protein
MKHETTKINIDDFKSELLKEATNIIISMQQSVPNESDDIYDDI